MVPGAQTRVAVTRFESPRHLGFDWDGGIHVDMNFQNFEDGTRVEVAINGFEDAELLEQATDSVEGFAIVLADLKLLLETGESPGLVRDKAALIIAAQAQQGG
jgi:hypothetical protein